MFGKNEKNINGNSDWARPNADRKVIIQAICELHKQKTVSEKTFIFEEGGTLKWVDYRMRRICKIKQVTVISLNQNTQKHSCFCQGQEKS